MKRSTLIRILQNEFGSSQNFTPTEEEALATTIVDLLQDLDVLDVVDDRPKDGA